MIKRTFKFSILIFWSVISSCNSNKTQLTKSSQISEPSRIIYLVDGKSVGVDVVNQGFEKGSLKIMGGTNNSRDALLYFGEKYRYGINIFNTINNQ